MKIYSMTATFGKLEHETLTLQPGLNIIEAPNEWGKSTWCAFLVNMLYGIDTRARTTGAQLADKERYAPWSGAPMAGRIDLNWNGRDITIERRSHGRIPFGDFKAYETATGIEINELTASNCGQQLLGVERSVFTRAGFLKFSDLPVAQDDSLRRRLNNLVTTGDESGAGDKLAQQLRDLKNKCRYNRSGLLPQAENEREQLRNQLDDLLSLNQQAEQIRSVQSQLEAYIEKLENHSAALEYAANREHTDKVTAAEEAAENAKKRLEAMEKASVSLLPREDAEQKLQLSKKLQEERMALQMESAMLPPLPEKPETPAHFRDIAPADAVAKAEADVAENEKLEKSRKKTGVAIGIFCGIAVAALAALAVLHFVLHMDMVQWMLLGGTGVMLIGLILIIVAIVRSAKFRKAQDKIFDRHPAIAPDGWVKDAQAYADAWFSYEVLLENAHHLRGDLDGRMTEIQSQLDELTGEKPLADCQNLWEKTVAAWDTLGEARREQQHAESYAETLKSLVRKVEPPKFPDTLTTTQAENSAALSEARLKQRQLHTQLGQCLGQAETIGSEALLRARLDTLNRRIARLEDTYYALELAQDSLREATMQLQRRFAPRISKRAQELLAKLTDGRYTKLLLTQDLSLNTAAEGEDTVRSTQWRSDGTTDQVYLALRLAVAEELTPDAPLILDDALVRFDDVRLKTAMDILKEEAASKQVIVFTCQGREKMMEESR